MTIQATKQRKQMLERRLAELHKELAKEGENLGSARGDDHEPTGNVQLLDVAERVGFITGRIQEIEEILNDMVEVEPVYHCVGIGSKVTLSLMRGDEIFDTIVAVIDGVADNKGPLPVCSPCSPMIEAILGATTEEDPRRFTTPMGDIFDIKVECIEPAYDY